MAKKVNKFNQNSNFYEKCKAANFIVKTVVKLEKNKWNLI